MMTNKWSFSKPSSAISESARRKNEKSSFEYWLAWMLLLALFFIFLFIFGENGLLQTGEMRKLNFTLTEEVKELLKENEYLKKEIKGLKEDPFYVEKVAREELDLVRPNEVVYHIVSSKENL